MLFGDHGGGVMVHTERNVVEETDFPLVLQLSEELGKGDRRVCVHGSACLCVHIALACIVHNSFSWLLTDSNVFSKHDFPHMI